MAEHATPKDSAKTTTSTQKMGQMDTAASAVEQAPYLHRLSGGASAPPPLKPSDVIYLQRAMGNHAVQQILPRAQAHLPTVQRAPTVRVSQHTGGFTIQRSLKAYRKAKLTGGEVGYLTGKLNTIKTGGGSLRRKLGIRSAKKAIDSLYAELKNEDGATALLDRLVDQIFGSDYRTMEKAGAHRGLISGGSSSDDYEEDEPIAPIASPTPSPSVSPSSPPSSSAPPGKKYAQGVVSKGMGKKDLGQEVYKGVDSVKQIDELEGGSASELANTAVTKLEALGAQVTRLIPGIRSGASGDSDSGIWATVKAAIMPLVNDAMDWAMAVKDLLDPSGIVSSSITLLKAIYDAIKLGLGHDKQKTLLDRAMIAKDFQLAHSINWVLGQTVKRWNVMYRTLASAVTSFSAAITKFIPGAQVAAPFLTLSSTLTTYGPRIFNRVRQWYRDHYHTKKSMTNKTQVAAHHGKTLLNAIKANVSGSRIRPEELDTEMLEALGMSPTDLMVMGSKGGTGSKVKGVAKAGLKGLPGIGGKVSISDEEAQDSGEEEQIVKVVSKVVGHGRYDAPLEKHFKGDFSDREMEAMPLMGGAMSSDVMSEMSDSMAPSSAPSSSPPSSEEMDRDLSMELDLEEELV